MAFRKLFIRCTCVLYLWPYVDSVTVAMVHMCFVFVAICRLCYSSYGAHVLPLLHSLSRTVFLHSARKAGEWSLGTRLSITVTLIERKYLTTCLPLKADSRGLAASRGLPVWTFCNLHNNKHYPVL